MKEENILLCEVIYFFYHSSHFFRDESKFDDTSRHVFTDVSIKLSIKEV